jgi:hypothetical protein
MYSTKYTVNGQEKIQDVKRGRIESSLPNARQIGEITPKCLQGESFEIFYFLGMKKTKIE